MNSKEKFKPIFKKQRKKRKSNVRLLLEIVIMLFVGLNLSIFINTLPGKFVFVQFISDTWIDLSKGVVLLFESLINIGAVVIILLLLISCLILIIGSISRILILIKRLSNKTKRNKYQNK
tara:strand:+ start:179 stop:538 length:360 start_codon:yes stop_codon:yes gene_type:complete